MSEVQVKFVTKQEKYAIPDIPYVMPRDSDAKKLSALIKCILKNLSDEEKDALQFNFYVLGEALNSTLLEHLEERDLSTEATVEIEYAVKCQAPTPENSLVHDDWVSSVKIADNWVLSGCYDNTVHIWSTTGAHKLTIPGHVAPIKSVAWIKMGDPICSFVSTSHDETAIIWEWNQNTNAVECAHVCKGHQRSVDCVDVHQDKNKIVTGSYDQTLKVWSTTSNELFDCGTEEIEGADKKKQRTLSGKSKTSTPLMTLSGHTEGISGIQWNDICEVCSCSLDCTIRLWDIELGGLKSQLNGSKAFLDLSYSNLSRQIISASADRHIRLWDTRLKSAAVVKSVFSSHEGWVTSVKWSPHNENNFVSGSFDHVLKLWDIRNLKAPAFDLSGHEDKVLCVEWSKNNFLASGGADCHVKIYKNHD